ncbi:MAG: K(+)-transporting ATPase subunit F [Rhodospirillales bacterium]|nr:K(+)-transporting ATPase subunit F [Rhodospirillales bacterium]
MTLDVVLGLCSVIGLAAYLVYVLIHPERF